MSEHFAGWPTVSVVMPVRDEAAHLERSVEAILLQEYPGELGVCLAVGPSHDGSEDIARRLAERDPAVGVVVNPSGRTAAALNAAIRATTGDVVVRVDGHAVLAPGYVQRAVETLQRTGAVNVGGIQDARGVTPFERAVAAAMASRFGTGGARFHVGGTEGPVDTVYLGAFRRTAIEAVGLFDEDLIRNQDYELNIRLRQAGGAVWFDPHLRVEYRPRGSARALARQYFEYGFWKARVARQHPASLKPRQVAPVVAVVALAGAALCSRWSRAARAVPAAYATSVVVSALRAGQPPGVRARLLIVFPVMHIAWGAGFLAALARASSLGRRSRRR